VFKNETPEFPLLIMLPAFIMIALVVTIYGKETMFEHAQIRIKMLKVVQPCVLMVYQKEQNINSKFGYQPFSVFSVYI
jgi:hypothetical protein